MTLVCSIAFVALEGCSGDSTPPATMPDASKSDASPPDAASSGDGPSTDSSDASSDAAEAGPPKVSTTPSHGSTIALTGDDSRLVVANHDVGTATVLSVSYPSGGLPALSKLAEITVGAEPSAVAVHPDGDTAFVLSRKDQKLVKITGLLTTPVKGGEVAVGSEPTGLAMTPLGTMIWVANWVDGTLMGIKSDTMTVATTIDLNAALAAAPYLGPGLTSRPALAHPRAVAITNNLDTVENDETIYVTEYFAQQKTPLKSDASNADTNWVGVLYKIPLATKAVSLIEIPPMMDMGFQDHNGGTAGCFPNQINSINIQGGFGYVTSTCASPKGPIGVFAGPAAAVCTADATCPGAAVGSCGGLVAGTCTGATAATACHVAADCLGVAGATGVCTGAVNTGTCKTNCAVDLDCGKVGGKCGTSAPNVCDPNPSDVKTSTAPTISIIDLGGNKTFATVNLAKEFSSYFDVKPPYDVSAGALPSPLADDATRRLPMLPADIGFVPGTVTAYLPAYGADAVFRVDFDATYAAATIDSLGDPKKKNPFMSLFSPAIDPAHNGQLPSGIVVAHATHTAGSDLRYAFTINERTRNVTVLDLSAQEIAGLSAGTPTVAAASAPATDPAEIDRLEGKRKFITGLGRWSWKGQAWQGCISCHGDGLTDNVSWYLGRGPRQSPNIDGSFVKGAAAKNDPTDYRVNSWEGVQDEIADHEGAIRSLSGGVGAIVKNTALAFSSRLDVAGQTGLNGSSLAVADPANPEMLATPSVLNDWQQIVAWARTVRSPRRPSNLDPARVTAGQALFTTANCQGCHGGPLWTISQVFYKPDATGVINNKLKTLSWAAAVQAANFPAALLPVANGLPLTGTLPPLGVFNTNPPAAQGQPVTYSLQTMRYSGNKPAFFDQLTCAIRNVGTYGVAQAEAGIAELRGDMVTPAQGNDPDCKGFNPPPLLNVVTGAPYLHGGNALTLESLFSPTFQAHHQALSAGFLDAADPMRADKVASLIQFVLSIDGDTPPMAIPALGPTGGTFCAAQ
jgi:mono/diheme cytochrome c family protein